MGVTEILLIIIGIIILVLSYVLPAKEKEKGAEQAPKVDEKLIKELVEKEIQDEKHRINDVLDETITYSMEKTERAMERLTNEKMMAVNEYSDQVLEAINKNHQEVIFLYDMLNDKHDNLVTTVSEASKKAQEIKQTVQDAEITVKEACVTKTENAEMEKENAEAAEKLTEAPEIQAAEKEDNAAKAEFVPISPEVVKVVNGMLVKEAETILESASAERASMERLSDSPEFADEPLPEKTADAKNSRNSNEIILRLHKLGKSKTAIAKELNLGVGEVKLVIDLFEKS